MADNITLNPGTGGAIVATDDVGGVQYQVVKLALGGDGAASLVSTALPVSGAVSVSNLPSTQAVSGTVAVSNMVAQGLTDAQIRATPVPVSLSGVQTINPVDAQSSGNLNIVGQTVEVALNGFGSCSIDLRASAVPAFAGTILFEARTDATNWEPIIGYLTGSDGERFTQITEAMTNNSFRFSVAGLQAIRARLTTLTLGNVDVTVRASAPTSAVIVNSPVAVLATRRDADTTPAINGATHRLFSDEAGRLKVSAQPASYSDITGDITAIQATINTPVAGGTVVGDVSRASNIMAFCTGTFAGINVTFEGSIEASGETNWFGIQAVRTNANTIETTTGALSAVPAYAWELSVNALARLRVRATARTSGTQSWRFKLGTYATEPIPAAQVSATQPVSGTVTATVGTSISGGTISPLTVAGVSAEASSAKTTSGQSAAAQTNASGRNAHFIVNVSALSGTTPAVVVRVQVQDPVSSLWVDLPGAASASISTVSTTLFTVTNLARTYRLAWVVTGTTPSLTFSVGILPVI